MKQNQFIDQILNAQEDYQAAGQNFKEPVTNEMLDGAYLFSNPCNVCGELGENRMCSIQIPHFKNITIMAFTCQECGNRDTEVKSIGETTAQGKIITLNVSTEQDLKREVFKSETASLQIPEVELELTYGTLGGVYSSVEGLLETIISHMSKHFPIFGDPEQQFKSKMQILFDKLQAFQDGHAPFTLIIKDLVDNSFVSNPYHPGQDKNVIQGLFDRDADDDDYLGIDTMNTENYL